MQGSARKDVVFGAARVYTFTVPGPKWKSWSRALPIFVFLLVLASSCEQHRSIPPVGYRGWEAYGGGAENLRYSALDQINRDNVGQLEVAWTYDTGDVFEGSEMQCNPIVVDDVLYATSPKMRVLALNAGDGELIWSFDPFEGELTRQRRNRGVVYWAQGDDRRILFTARHFLYALNADDGKSISSFGDNGRVDLREAFERDRNRISISAATPGVIYKDLLILGSLLSESLPSAPGDIRAYDVRTGELRWSFHTIPHPGEFGHETWPADAWKYIGGANNWAGMSVDVERGIVFCPTGSAAFDFYGANRVGDNLFANTLLALDAASGKRLWHFQNVRHDVWDRDFPAPPNLVRVKRGGRFVDAVAQIAKSGHVWVFDRETGETLFPIEYRDVPLSQVEGEVLATQQPLPLKPPPFARQIFTENMVTRRTPEAYEAVMRTFRTIHSGDQFTAPSLAGTVIFPGYDGGGEWGGAAFDPQTGLLYVNANEMPWILRLVEKPPADKLLSGRDLYLSHCASCHKDDFSGTPPEFPSLAAVGDKLNRGEFIGITRRGAGRMPGFGHLGADALKVVADYVMYGEDASTTTSAGPSPIDLRYASDGYNKFLDPDGYPAVEPPWGTLNAIDLDAGEIAWKVPFGEFPELVAQGIKDTGSENYGGPIVTAGGLVFIGATNHDAKFHVFDKLTGELLWETKLPAGGNATPAMYEVDGRQFVVIGAGGGKSGQPSGGSYVAFALPADEARR